MSGKYRAVGWNRQKAIYDFCVFVMVMVVLIVYARVTLSTHGSYDPMPIRLMERATALGAIILLHLILCIGPLARLNPVFLPLLYNRRHIGVAMFLLCLMHALPSTLMFHGMGSVNPLVSVFTSYKMEYTGGRISDFPFEPFGFLALLIFLVMAATSHDFWLKFLGASFWKTMHIGVYVAYAFIIIHVSLGILQSETSPVYPVFLGVGFAIVLGLHIAAGNKEKRLDKSGLTARADGFVPTCKTADLKEGCGNTVMVQGERRAVFLNEGKVYALSNVCRHQGGPISEGRILDGCVTCPWHGWQYRPESGVSPPPFHEVIETYPVRIEDGTVYVHSDPNPLEQKMDGTAL